MARAHSLNRRSFLLATTAVTAGTLLPRSFAANVSQAVPTSGQSVIPSRDTLLKFSLDGTRRPFAGNTVICHMPAQCPMRDAMVELRSVLSNAPYRHKLGLTSADSYHMTIFPGANDQGRDASGWPSYVPLDASIDLCNRMVGERMATARLACELPLRVRVDQATTLRYPTACTMRMQPIDDAEDKKIRSVRDHLSDIYGFRLRGHDTYQFHITMSYQLAPFTEEEQSSYRSLLAVHIPRIAAAQPELELGNPEYCTFPDMFRFDPVHLLTCS